RGSTPQLVEYGLFFGKTALLLFCVTLLPGIIQRLRLYPALLMPLSSIIVMFRRHIGILTFLLISVHLAFVSVLPRFIFQGRLLPATLPQFFELMGITAWLLLFPVWLTSNDTSMQMLG